MALEKTALEKVETVTGRGVYVPGNDIDTDRIIPARFMKCVTFDGLGRDLFFDARFDGEEQPKKHSLNDPRFAGASIIISNDNFGCGSSREHAPQAIAKGGFSAIIAEGFAEIFFGNSTTLGIPCVQLSHEDIVKLAAVVESDPQTKITIDLEAEQVRAGAEAFTLTMKASARDALLAGEQDPIAALLASRETVATRAALPD